jgi:parvulin-like peptidyl-prolyl isomerase
VTARPLWLLGGGAALGVIIAAVGVVRTPRSARATPADAVAMVNGVPISLAAYEAALTAVAGDRRDGAVDPALRQRVLDRLIEEELLVQRGLALGLVRLDPRVRADLVAAVLAEIDAEADLAPPPATEALAALHAGEPERFRQAPRLTVSTVWFAGDDGAARAAAARAAITDDVGWTRLRAASDRSAVVVPAGPVPAGGLLDVLGPTATRAALTLPVGEVSAPVVTSGGAWLVRVEARDDGGVRALADAGPEVLAEWRKREGDRRLREVLVDERRAARIRLAPRAVAAARPAAEDPDVDEVPR